MFLPLWDLVRIVGENLNVSLKPLHWVQECKIIVPTTTLKWREKNLRKDPRVLFPADKTNNLCRLTTGEEYNTLLTEKIPKSYIKTDKSSLNRLNTKAKNIAKDLKLEERVEQHSHHQSFITLKGHRDKLESIIRMRNKVIVCNIFISNLTIRHQ